MIYRMYRQINDGLDLGFYIETIDQLSEPELKQIQWLIAETFEPGNTGIEPHITASEAVEIGPRLSIETPFSSNAVSICQAMGLRQIIRIERTHRYAVGNDRSADILKTRLDRMTEQHYPNGIESFDTGTTPEDVRVIDLAGRGKTALEEMNNALGLGMDAQDLEYYQHLFVEVLRRNPTDVELFQLGNANSEHSRHWYFKGQLVIDGTPMQETLFEIVQRPLKSLGSDNCSLVAFKDNAGVIKGFGTRLILPIVRSDAEASLASASPVTLSGTFSFLDIKFRARLSARTSRRSTLRRFRFSSRAATVYRATAISSANPSQWALPELSVRQSEANGASHVSRSFTAVASDICSTDILRRRSLKLECSSCASAVPLIPSGSAEAQPQA